MSRDDTYFVDILESAKIALEYVADSKEISSIPGRDLTMLRNLVIHQYDAIDINQVWDTTQNRLPPLVEELSKIIPPE